MPLPILTLAALFVCIIHGHTIAADPVETTVEPSNQMIRIATYNVSLYDKAPGLVRDRLADGTDRQAAKIAAVIQTVRPDILLVNEIDYDEGGETAKLFADKFLAQSQRGLDPIDYPFVYAAPSNTGIDSMLDLNGDGKTGNPTDAWGFGTYPGQYSFAVLSRFPINETAIRTFQKFLWRDFPDAKKPIDPKTGQPHYPSEVWDSLRLSSKNHVDVPIQIGKETVHLLASHPTPPVFDGPEDRNGNRNHDEVCFWNHYISVQQDKGVSFRSAKKRENAAFAERKATNKTQWLTDDQGRSGGIDSEAFFVVAGDLNTDPTAGDSKQAAIIELIGNDRVADAKPTRTGNPSSQTTASFGPRREMRIDYVLPSSNFKVTGSGVFWPAKSDPDYELITATDHRMVWIEVQLP